QYTLDTPGTVPNRQDKTHPHSTFPDPSGAFLISADLGADVVRVFAISESGTLTECPDASASPGTGPRHGAFWEGGNSTVLYTVNELGNSVSSWEVTSGDCLTLTENQIISTYPEGTTPPEGTKAAEILIRDNFLYASNRFDKTFGETSDSIALFEIGEDGALTFVELADSGANFPRTMDINAAGDMIAVGGQTSSDVVILERDSTSGRLGSVLAKLQVGKLGGEGQEDGLSGVVWVE
ncbi:beta-propeller fold lactonase family protein, partial [Candidatus Bathyarchaeota archaeon]|nr:beta-propeller fold lactonase family protein [Candidatus Bathyarchaeota archaeon]